MATVSIRFTAPSETDIVFVKIYESSTAGGTYSLIDTKSYTAGQTSVTTTLALSVSDWFKISFVDALGHESDLSAPVSAAEGYTSVQWAYIVAVRILLGDYDPSRYRHNPLEDGINDDGTGYKWFNIELKTYIEDLALNFINNVYSPTTSWTLSSIPCRALLMEGACIYAVRAKGRTERNETLNLNDGGAQLTIDRAPAWEGDASSSFQDWKESVKLFKLSIRPTPIGLASSIYPVSVPSLISSFPHMKGFGL